MKLIRGILAGAAFALALAPFASIPAKAAGMWSTLPGIGYPSYCASTVTGTGGLGSVTGTGQGTVGSICGLTVPAGPPVFAGTEYLPVDINALGSNSMAGGAQTATVSLLQLGQGPMLDLTTVGTAQTIPNATPWYFLDGAQASALTVTMPATAIEGQIQHVTCESATVGAVTVAANTGQTLKGNPAAACVVGVTYNWRYQASSTTWFRF